MTLEKLKSRFEELLNGLKELDNKIDGLTITRDITCSEMNEVANQIWEIEDSEGFARFKRGPQ